MKRHLAALAFVALAFAVSSTAQAQQAITPDQLVGAWRLRSMVTRNATTGKDTVSPLSIGYVTFVRDGKNLRGSVNFAAPDRKEAGTTATDAEAIELFKSYTAYSAIVELGSAATANGTPVTVNIDVDLNQSALGTYHRTYVIDGTKLTVTTKVPPDITTAAVFEKVQ